MLQHETGKSRTPGCPKLVDMSIGPSSEKVVKNVLGRNELGTRGADVHQGSFTIFFAGDT